MDRIDAMKVFVAAVDEGSLAGAGRRLRRSPAAVSRAIAFLEAHVGTELLHRTTRSLKLSEAGERYVAACRRVLVDLEEADIVAGSERSAPRGTLTLTAPIITGEAILRSIVEAFMNEYQAVSARLYLLDRPVNLIDEGIDIALRIAHLAEFELRGNPRRRSSPRRRGLARISGAAPGAPRAGGSCQTQIIAMTHFGLNSSSFPPAKGSSVPKVVQFTPRLVVNTVRAAINSAVEGRGITRLFSYHIADEIREGRLQILLGKDEHPPLPAHLLVPQGRLSVPKVRAFVDFAAPRLKRYFLRLTDDANRNADAIRSRGGRVPSE